MTTFNEIGIAVPQVLFPAEGTDLAKWATIACDQFTAQPEYWAEVQRRVGFAPSTLFMQMPEAWLPLRQFEDLSGAEARTHEAAIPQMMKRYLSDGTLTELPEGFIFIKRQTTTGVRRGLLALIDLERYEYAPGNKALIRATEGT
ncbi:MAG: DUF1015 family protein, partial [Desulfovibrionaceae bacterium]|nr:DUF1015 family protein [Desulfovibrionaceae bacterium]